MSTYATRRRPAVTAGDQIAAEALRLLARVDLARVSAPGIFVNDLIEAARRLYEQSQSGADRG